MQSMQNVLVGVDVNADGELPRPTRVAVDKAFWLAETAGAKVTLFSVSETPVVESEAVLEGQAPEAETALTKAHETLRSEAQQRNITMKSQIVIGRSWYKIIQEVMASQIDLVILGTRDRGRTRRMLYGSTAMKLLRKCPCPVWVVRPDDNENEIPLFVAADDLTDMGLKILHTAVSAAQLADARLLVVNAVDFPLEGGLMRTEASSEDLNEYRQKVRAEAEQEVMDRLSMTDYRTLQQGTQIEITAGPPEAVIENAVSSNKADLLIMGTIARGGVPGFLFGNTAERLLPDLDCSLLALKPDDFVCPIAAEEA